MTPQEENDDLINKFLLFTQAIEKFIHESQPQQVFVNSTVFEGIHYNENQDFLINNLWHTYDQIERVKKGDHIQVANLIKDYDNSMSVDDLKRKLMRQYNQDVLRYLSNWCNLSFSEN